MEFTPWKILVLAERESELRPLRSELERAGKSAELSLVRTLADVVAVLDRGPCDAAVLTAHGSQLHLAHVLAELHRRDPAIPVLLVARAADLAGLQDALRIGIAGVVVTEALALLGPMLEREILRGQEMRARHLRQQRAAWLESAIQAAPAALAIVDRHGRLRWANAAYLTLAGLTAERLEGEAVPLLGPEAERWAEVRETAKSGAPWRGPVAAESSAGTATLHHLTVAALSEEAGGPWFVAERRVAESTGASTPEAHAAAQRSELFAAIAGGIAHDLNNILAPITMAAGILVDQGLSEENSELVHTIEHSAERGAAVIRQVLTFANGSDNCAMDLQPRYLLREVARLASEIFPPNIGVRAEIPSALWTITGDPGEIHQALINLLLNARDAMPDGGHIAITAQNCTFATIQPSAIFSAVPGDFVEVSVEDTGPGVDPEYASRIWEPFVTSKGAGQAAGLGLSRVAGVLRSHGGFGQLRARHGCGTKVSLYFPRATAAAVRSVVEEGVIAPRETGRILVVDDEESILTLSRRILERAGYEVLVASEGREALGLFARHRAEIGLVLTDLAMPGMNGFTLLWALRRSKPDLRVMVATGQGSETNLRELELMGVREVLLKPFSSRRLLDAVARTLAEPVRCEPDLFLDAVAANGA